MVLQDLVTLIKRFTLMPKKRKNLGYTLMEVLLATFIFSVLVIISTHALNQGIMHYQNLMKRGLNFWEDTKVFSLIKVFKSALDYYVYDETAKIWFPFFEGNQERISFVTGSPLFYDVPTLVIITLEKDKHDQYSLVYYETPVYTLNYKELKEILNFRKYTDFKNIKLFENLRNVRFNFLYYDPSKRGYFWALTHKNFYPLLPCMVEIILKHEDFEDVLYFSLPNQNLVKNLYNELYVY